MKDGSHLCSRIEKEDVPADQLPTSTTPRTSVSISGASKVTTPKIRPAHEAEATDVGAKITGWSKQADKKRDQKVADQAKAAEELKALEEAERVIKRNSLRLSCLIDSMVRQNHRQITAPCDCSGEANKEAK